VRRRRATSRKPAKVQQTIKAKRGAAVEQLSATSEVLKVISSSPGELEPAFNAMLKSAGGICDAQSTSIFLRDGDDVSVVIGGYRKLAHFFVEASILRD
jgi:hypothetical protein